MPRARGLAPVATITARPVISSSSSRTKRFSRLDRSILVISTARANAGAEALGLLGEQAGQLRALHVLGKPG